MQFLADVPPERRTSLSLKQALRPCTDNFRRGRMAYTLNTSFREALRAARPRLRAPGAPADFASALTATVALLAGAAAGSTEFSASTTVSFWLAWLAGAATFVVVASQSGAFRPLQAAFVQWPSAGRAVAFGMCAHGFLLSFGEAHASMAVLSWWLAFAASSFLLRYLSSATASERPTIVLAGEQRAVREAIQKLLLDSENAPFEVTATVETGPDGLSAEHLAAIRHHLSTNAVQAVFVTGPVAQERFDAFARLCRASRVPYARLRTDACLSAQPVAGRMLGIEWPPQPIRGEFVKRAVDIAGASFLLLLLGPILLVLSALVRRDGGPALYAHRRIGQHGRMFDCLKFRSMVRDSDAVLRAYLDANPHAREEWASTQKLRDDPRVTRVGAVLRRFSLDELPQLLNVLRGEMSLVGPRPIVPAEAARYGDAFSDYCSASPGMTGLWQISGRNDIDYRERVLLDSWYARQRNFWLDLFILLRTPAAVLLRRGAY